MVREIMDSSSRGRFDSPFKGKMVKWKDGINIARILPATFKSPSGHFAMQVYEHRYVGSENSHYLCLEKMRNQRCPICEAERKVRDREDDKDRADKLRARSRWVMYLLNRKDEQNKLQAFIWDIWDRANEEIMAVTQDYKTGAVIHPEDLDNGYDLTFRRTGSGDRTQYGGWMFDREPSPAADSVEDINTVQAFIEEHPLDTMLRFYDAEYLEKVLYGTAEQVDEDLDGAGDDYPEPEADLSPRSRFADEETQGNGAAYADDDQPEGDAPWGEETTGDEAITEEETQDEGAVDDSDPPVEEPPPRQVRRAPPPRQQTQGTRQAPPRQAQRAPATQAAPVRRERPRMAPSRYRE